MDLNTYQQEANRTAIYPGAIKELVDSYRDFILTGKEGADPRMVLRLNYVALGLAGEAGEFANKTKKIIRDRSGFLTDGERGYLAQELGGVLWYVAAAAKELGFALHEIAVMNLAVLADRHERDVISGSGDDR